MTHFVDGAKKKSKLRRKAWIALPVVGVLGGLYMLVNVYSPALPASVLTGGVNTAERLTSKQPGEMGSRLYIPKINVDVAIAQGDVSALQQGAWWRKPENGNPATGGNFVLSAHRFELGLTPQQTRAKSPFYHLDKLQVDDELYVDYDGTRYIYKVTDKYHVPRTATEIEQRTDDPRLTLYSCDLRGETAGRDVVEALPIGIVD